MTYLQKLAADTALEFAKIYGRPPRWIVAAPGRVNVIGEHTDYNDGFVLPMAIEFYSVMAADQPVNGQNIITLHSTMEKAVVTIDLSTPVRPGTPKWGNYPRGVVAGFLARHQPWRAGRAPAFHRAAGQRFEQQRRAGSLHRDAH
jgi:galactokinase